MDNIWHPGASYCKDMVCFHKFDDAIQSLELTSLIKQVHSIKFVE